MRFAKLDENGKLYYEEPDDEPLETRESIKAAIEYYKSLEG